MTKRLSNKEKQKILFTDPFGDYDKDGVLNIKDCRPFDKSRHWVDPYPTPGGAAYPGAPSAPGPTIPSGHAGTSSAASQAYNDWVRSVSLTYQLSRGTLSYSQLSPTQRAILTRSSKYLTPAQRFTIRTAQLKAKVLPPATDTLSKARSVLAQHITIKDASDWLKSPSGITIPKPSGAFVHLGESLAGRNEPAEAAALIGQQADASIKAYETSQKTVESTWKPYIQTRDGKQAFVAPQVTSAETLLAGQVKEGVFVGSPEFRARWKGKISEGTFIGTPEEFRQYKSEYSWQHERYTNVMGAAYATQDVAFQQYSSDLARLNQQATEINRLGGNIEQLNVQAEAVHRASFFGLMGKYEDAQKATVERYTSKIMPEWSALSEKTKPLRSLGHMAIGAEYKVGIPSLTMGSAFLHEEYVTPHARGWYEGWKYEPVKTAATWGTFLVLPGLLKGVGAATKALKLAPKSVGGVLPEVTKHIPKGLGYAMGTAYTGSVGYRVATAESPAYELGRIGATEFVPMGVGWKLGEKVLAGISKIPYRVHYDKPPKQLLIEMGEVPITTRPKLTSKALALRGKEGLIPERYVSFIGKSKSTLVGKESPFMRMDIGGRITTIEGAPIMAETAPLYVRAPRAATADILGRFSFEGTPRYVTTPYGSYIKVGKPTRIPTSTVKLIEGQTTPFRTSKLWISRTLDISPTKISMQRVPSRLSLPEFAPDVTATYRPPARGEPWTAMVKPREISGFYPTFTRIKPVSIRPLLPITEPPIPWSVTGIETATTIKGHDFFRKTLLERETVEDILREQGLYKPKGTKCFYCIDTPKSVKVSELSPLTDKEYIRELELHPQKQLQKQRTKKRPTITTTKPIVEVPFTMEVATPSITLATQKIKEIEVALSTKSDLNTLPTEEENMFRIVREQQKYYPRSAKSSEKVLSLQPYRDSRYGIGFGYSGDFFETRKREDSFVILFSPLGTRKQRGEERRRQYPFSTIARSIQERPALKTEIEYAPQPFPSEYSSTSSHLEVPIQKPQIMVSPFGGTPRLPPPTIPPIEPPEPITPFFYEETSDKKRKKKKRKREELGWFIYNPIPLARPVKESEVMPSKTAFIRELRANFSMK